MVEGWFHRPKISNSLQRRVYLFLFSPNLIKHVDPSFENRRHTSLQAQTPPLRRIEEAYHPQGMITAFRDILSTVARKNRFTAVSRDLSAFSFFFYAAMKTKNHRPIEFLESTSARASITYPG